jgi:hypothetical protein
MNILRFESFKILPESLDLHNENGEWIQKFFPKAWISTDREWIQKIFPTAWIPTMRMGNGS